jgi:hypothetical protein
MKNMNTYTPLADCEYRMWPNGPTIELPDEYHWDSIKQEVVRNDHSWRGDLLAFWKLQHGK